MKERLDVHRQIEAENHEHMENFMCKLYWDSLTAEEVASMIQEKDRAMEWDEQFGFLCWLLEEKNGNKVSA
jgi:hypothetical protein